MKAWTTFGLLGSDVVLRVDAEPGPDRREAAERLAAGEAVAAVDPLGLRRRVEQRQVVARLAVPGREDLAPGALLQHPLQRRVAQAVQVGGDAHPVQVHVGRQRGGRRAVGQAALLAADLGQRHPEPAELARDRHLQVAGLLQLLEVLVEEAVLTVVAGGALPAARDQLVGQHGRNGSGGSHRSPPRTRGPHSNRRPQILTARLQICTSEYGFLGGGCTCPCTALTETRISLRSFRTRRSPLRAVIWVTPQSRPCSAAQTATCARELKPSLFRMWTTWLAAVPSVMTSASAICRLVSPRAISAGDLLLAPRQDRGRRDVGSQRPDGTQAAPAAGAGDGQRRRDDLVQVERAAGLPGGVGGLGLERAPGRLQRPVQPCPTARRERCARPLVQHRGGCRQARAPGRAGPVPPPAPRTAPAPG